MTGNGKHCERLLAIDLKRADGSEVSPGERAAYERHLAECEACRVERKALNAMARDEGAGPNAALDDIARRRYVDQVLERFDVPEHDERASLRDGPRPAIRLTLGVAAALAAAAAIAVVFVVASRTGEGEQGSDLAVPSAPVSYSGRVVLVAGGASVDAPLLTGEEITTGRIVKTGPGRAILSLPTGIAVAVQPESHVVLTRADGESFELDLKGGRLVALVNPGRDGPPIAVVTRQGKITVTGTVFAVEDTGKEVEVRVIRGEVTVADEVGRGTRSVGPAEVTTLGRAGVRTASPAESAAAWKAVSAFDLLDPGAGAIVDVRSIPAGAEVMIDGVSLGQTPVTAAIRAGHRRLELTLDDREPVREFVDVLDGETVSRAFDLRPSVAAAVDAALDVADDVEDKRGAQADDVDPAALLELAQELRGSRDWAGAARAYRELIRRAPGSAEATSAMVSLAQIELGKLGKPGKALRRFDSYLSRHPRGSLALEALLGRARALRALGRPAEERKALERFLERFPDALQAGEARLRLEALGSRDEG